MRLIDADKLKEHYSWWEGFDNLKEQKRDFDTIVDIQPTIEAEPKHGRWIKTTVNPDGTPNLCKCSECGFYSKVTNYCSNCGARMDEVEE